MKIRTGFVSNSSSTSFVVFGAEINQKTLDALRKKIEAEDPDNADAWYMYLDDLGNDEIVIREGSEDGMEDGVCVIGKELARERDYSLEQKALSIKDLEKLAAKLSKKINKKLGINQAYTFKLYTGTRAC